MLLLAEIELYLDSFAAQSCYLCEILHHNILYSVYFLYVCI